MTPALTAGPVPPITDRPTDQGMRRPRSFVDVGLFALFRNRQNDRRLVFAGGELRRAVDNNAPSKNAEQCAAESACVRPDLAYRAPMIATCSGEPQANGRQLLALFRRGASSKLVVV